VFSFDGTKVRRGCIKGKDKKFHLLKCFFCYNFNKNCPFLKKEIKKVKFCCIKEGLPDLFVLFLLNK